MEITRFILKWTVFLVAGAVAMPSIAAPDDDFALLSQNCDAENSPQACAAVGDYLWTLDGNKLSQCTSPFGSLCIRRLEAPAAAVARIDKIALRFHEKACELDHAEACNKAGVAFAVAYARASDAEAPGLAKEAEVRFEKACRLASSEGCKNVGSTRPGK